jgi:tetratricopeptide (TPR) repeat protein/energy-coupling factor transporter ATP-binding protein EcfA2
MRSKARLSLKSVLARRQRDLYVERVEQTDVFLDNLRLPEEERRFVFAISGPGGVGKTTLLHRLRGLVDDVGGVTALVDAAERDAPEAMARIAEQLRGSDKPLKAFGDRYQTYLTKRDELEADPDAPGLPSMVAGSITRGGVVAARRIPFAGAAFDLVDPDDAAKYVADWADFISRKLKSKDEVRLMREPVAVLTPLFLEGIRKIAEEHLLALFLDTYEQTSSFLDKWLRELLEEQHGEVPANILFTIAGREELDRDAWAPYAALVVRLSLEPFTDEEARKYLERAGVRSPEVVDEILSLTGRLPLLVATLAADAPVQPDQLGDATGLAIERFLKWVEDPNARRVALECALPRTLNRDVIAAMANGEADENFAWLRRQPFVAERRDGWVYHEVVRRPMVRHARREGPVQWAEAHDRLARYYEELFGSDGGAPERWNDSTWAAARAEALYHRLCHAPQAELAVARRTWVRALAGGTEAALRCGEAICDAGLDAEADEVHQWGECLRGAASALAEGDDEESLRMLRMLLAQADLPDRERSQVHFLCGFVRRQAGAFAEAIEDFSRAIDLVGPQPHLTAARADTYALLHDYAAAIEDISSAIELDSANLQYLIRRVQLRMERASAEQDIKSIEMAVADLDRAIEAAPDVAPLFAARAGANRTLGRPQAAVEDYCRAIEIDPDAGELFKQRADAYMALRRPVEALADLERAAEKESKPDDAVLMALRARALVALERAPEALVEVERALAQVPKTAGLLATRAYVYDALDRREDALVDLDRAVELEPEQAEWRAQRAEIYGALRRREEALADISTAIELEPRTARFQLLRAGLYAAVASEAPRLAGVDEALRDIESVIALGYETPELLSGRQSLLKARAELHLHEGQPVDALADVELAVEKDPDDVELLVLRARALVALERAPEALVELGRALARVPASVEFLAIRARAYDALGRREEALVDLDRAVELEPEQAEWRAQRSDVYLALGRGEEALAEISAAIEHEPKDARLLLARIGIRLDDATVEAAEQALPDVDRVLELAPEASVFFGQAKLYTLLGRFDDAVASYTHALELDPENVEYVAARAPFNLALERTTDANADFDRALAADPENADLLAGRAEARLLDRRADEALEDAARAAELDPSGGWATFVSSVALHRLGRDDESRLLLDTAVAQGEEAVAREPGVGHEANLALYLLASGDVERAETQYAEAMQPADITPAMVITALRDLDLYATALPSSPDTEAVACIRARVAANLARADAVA